MSAELLPGMHRGFGEGNISWFLERQELMVNLLLDIKPEKLIEIGFNEGHSAHLICQTIQKLKEVDPSYKDKKVDFYIFDVCVFPQNIENFEILKEHWKDVVSLHLHPGNSHETVRDFMSKNDYLFDFIEIDGDHSYEGLKKDILDTWERVSSRGIIFIDDYKSTKFSIGAIDVCIDNFNWEDFDTFSIDGVFWATPSRRSLKKDLVLKIHNPCGPKTRYFRNYNLFWDELTDALKEKYTIIENREFEEAHTDKFFTTLSSSAEPILVKECEYVIEDQSTGDFQVLSVSDELSPIVIREKDNPKFKKAFISQFIEQKISENVKDVDIMEKYSPWIYFQQDVFDLEPYYTKRQGKSHFIDKLYFSGTPSSRPILNHFDKTVVENARPKPKEQYFDELIDYRVGLSIAGVGELCYRDVEYMILGIPFIRFEFQTQLVEPLIPNYHYISIPYDYTIPKNNDVCTDRLGEYKHAKKIEARFMEVIGNKEYLSFVGANARKYYLDHLSPKVRIKKTLKLLGL